MGASAPYRTKGAQSSPRISFSNMNRTHSYALIALGALMLVADVGVFHGATFAVIPTTVSISYVSNMGSAAWCRVNGYTISYTSGTIISGASSYYIETPFGSATVSGYSTTYFQDPAGSGHYVTVTIAPVSNTTTTQTTWTTTTTTQTTTIPTTTTQTTTQTTTTTITTGGGGGGAITVPPYSLSYLGGILIVVGAISLKTQKSKRRKK